MGAQDLIVPAAGSVTNRSRYRVDPCDPGLVTYLCACFDQTCREELRVIYCDKARHYLFDEIAAAGCANQLVTGIRPLFERALSLGAGGILLAHNHPSGDCRPSSADLRSTLVLRDIAAALEVELIDHLIFARGRYFSMARGGYL